MLYIGKSSDKNVAVCPTKADIMCYSTMAASVGKKRVSVALRHIHFVLVILRG
jgi:hypothetical protein